ncbi:hypothetical protein AOLI_G00013650 [Acnodon oligacanthus]
MYDCGVERRSTWAGRRWSIGSKHHVEVTMLSLVDLLFRALPPCVRAEKAREASSQSERSETPAGGFRNGGASDKGRDFSRQQCWNAASSAFFTETPSQEGGSAEREGTERERSGPTALNFIRLCHV